MKVTYNIGGTLEEGLFVVNEVRAITGMDPEVIVTDNQEKICFNKEDFRKLERGDIDAERYVRDNLIS